MTDKRFLNAEEIMKTEEAWGMLRDAVSNATLNPDGAFQDLPEPLQAIVHDPGTLVSMLNYSVRKFETEIHKAFTAAYLDYLRGTKTRSS